MGVAARFIDVAGEVNREMPTWIINKLIFRLNLIQKSIKGSKVLIIGMAYKKDVGDWRKSRLLKL